MEPARLLTCGIPRTQVRGIFFTTKQATLTIPEKGVKLDQMEPRSYKVRFIEPGIISYEDKNAGTVLVSKEALDRMAPSFKGCPVIFIPELHNDADKNNSFNLDDPEAPMPAGIVAEKPVWGEDGWLWVNLLVWDEGAIDALENKKHNVSCSYITDEEGPGGIWHELPYDAEVIDGHYMHMAIVPRPRYEGSRVFANCKGGPDNMGINLFKKKNAAAPAITDKKPDGVGPAAAEPAKDPAQAPATDDKKVLENDDSTEVDVNGTRVPLHELISDYVEKQGAGEPAGEEIAPETLVALPDGTQVSIADLIASYSGGDEGAGEPAPAMTNSTDADADDAGGKDTDPVKANSASKKTAPRTVNKKLQNAATSGDAFAVDTPMTKSERAALGRARYGLGKEKGGKE